MVCAAVSFCIVATGCLLMAGCDKKDPVGPPVDNRTILFNEGFEGDLSGWSDEYMITADANGKYPRMQISIVAPHAGTHSVTTDSGRRALVKLLDPRVESGIAGVEFYFMAQTAGGINFTIEIGQNAGSSGGLGYAYGIGFDSSDNLKCTCFDMMAMDPRNDAILTPLVSGQWYKGTVEVSFTSKTVSYSIDGVQKATRTLPDGVLGIDRLLVFRGTDGAEGPKPYFADDIKLYTK